MVNLMPDEIERICEMSKAPTTSERESLRNTSTRIPGEHKTQININDYRNKEKINNKKYFNILYNPSFYLFINIGDIK